MWQFTNLEALVSFLISFHHELTLETTYWRKRNRQKPSQNSSQPELQDLMEKGLKSMEAERERKQELIKYWRRGNKIPKIR